MITRTGYYGVLAPLLVGLLAAGLSLLVVGPGARGLVCGSSWSTVASGEHLRRPSAMAAIASNDVWVVGSTRDTPNQVRTGAEHWDGSGWSQIPTPNVGTVQDELNGVDAFASKDVWAVGYSTLSGRQRTLIEHWDGTRWRVVTSPNSGTNGDNALMSVDALSGTNAWAVGSSRTGTSRKSLIQRWDGTSWKIVSSPNPGTLSNSLLGVAAAGPKDIWAVGWKNSGNGLRSLILHYDGTRWTQAASVPRVGTGDNVLTGVSVVGNDDVWATGYYVDGTRYKTLTLHYDGTAWSRVPSRNGADGTSILTGIDASSSTDAWAVGFEYRATPHHYVATTQRWDGSGWTSFPSSMSRDGTQESAMFDVTKVPGTARVWAVGRFGIRLNSAPLTGVVETICPSGSSAATAPAQEGSGSVLTGSSAQSPEQPNSVPRTFFGSSASTEAASDAIPVRAVDKAAAAGISENTLTYGAIVADFDNDTHPDIFLGRHTEEPRLYENAGNGSFRETNQGTFARADRHGCDAADVDGDGLKDVFCTEGALQGTSPKRNELYIQRADHTFAERAAQYGVLDPFGRGRSAKFFDATGDGRPDLLVGNDPTRGDGLPSPNRFFTNQQGGAFRYAPAYGLERETSLQGGDADVGDLDKDGWRDLILNTPQGLRVYHNEQGKGFTDVTASFGLDQSPRDVTLADVNGDGRLDVIEVRPNELSVFVNTNGTFSKRVLHHPAVRVLGGRGRR